MTDERASFAVGESVQIRSDVPTWGGLSGTIERVAFDGSCRVRLSPMTLLWFDKPELVSDAHP